MMKKKKVSKQGTKRPGKVIYFLLAGILWLYAVVFKRHTVVSSLPDGLRPPYIVVGNHSSFYDFAYAVRAFYPERISFVVARKYFHFSGLSWVMKMARAIPKSLFQPDTGTIIAMFHVLKQGGVIGIYPEGQISMNGITSKNGESIAKFIKKAGVPVVGILTGGAYFCNPPWSHSSRKGRVESTVSLLLTKEQVRELPVDGIMERIEHGITIDNYAWQEVSGCLYRGKSLANGLQNILYLCPCCRSEFTMAARGNTISCQSCGTEGHFGEDGHLTWSGVRYFRHIGGWMDWQQENERVKIAAQLLENNEFTASELVELAMLKRKGKGTEVVGRGLFSAHMDAFEYAGTLRGEEVRLSFATAGVRCLPFDSGRNFQVYHNNELYEFRPNNPVWCMKIANICDGLYALRGKKPKTNLESLTM